MRREEGEERAEKPAARTRLTTEQGGARIYHLSLNRSCGWYKLRANLRMMTIQRAGTEELARDNTKDGLVCVIKSWCSYSCNII